MQELIIYLSLLVSIAALALSLKALAIIKKNKRLKFAEDILQKTDHCRLSTNDERFRNSVTKE
jgi:hypothetical protein